MCPRVCFPAQALAPIRAAYCCVVARVLPVHGAAVAWRLSGAWARSALSSCLLSFADACLRGALVERSAMVHGVCHGHSRRCTLDVSSPSCSIVSRALPRAYPTVVSFRVVQVIPTLQIPPYTPAS